MDSIFLLKVQYTLDYPNTRPKVDLGFKGRKLSEMYPAFPWETRESDYRGDFHH